MLLRAGFYERNDVPVINGSAHFVDQNHIEVSEDDGSRKLVRAKYFVIATGARPYRPAEIDFSHPCIFDSDTILGMKRDVKSIIVYGAGVIGCEYASMFRNLNCKVTLINAREKLLEYLDDEIIDALSYHFREHGMLIKHKEEFDHVECHGDGVVLYLKSGKKLKADALLWAAGRTGNSDGMGLDKVGITPDSRGNIPSMKACRRALHISMRWGTSLGRRRSRVRLTCRGGSPRAISWVGRMCRP